MLNVYNQPNSNHFIIDRSLISMIAIFMRSLPYKAFNPSRKINRTSRYISFDVKQCSIIILLCLSSHNNKLSTYKNISFTIDGKFLNNISVGTSNIDIPGLGHVSYGLAAFNQKLSALEKFPSKYDGIPIL